MSHWQVVVESLRWYITISALAWLMYPVIFRALAGLPSRGIPFVRPLGLMLASIVPWWLSAIGLTPYTTFLVIVIPVVVGLVLWVREARVGELWRFLGKAHRQVLTYELLTLALFAGYIVFRSYNPAIQHTEKPMELTFLNSLLHTRSMPPPDPWFLGKSINYYYLGYLLMALPARIAHIQASHAFNLALAILFASATVAAMGVAVDLATSRGLRPRVVIIATGALAAIFLVGMGNLYTPVEFIQHPLRTLHAPWWQGVGWNASRVISDGPNQQTINEFPAFSFVLGDLHPHVLDYPMFISALGIGLALAVSRANRRDLYLGSGLAGVVAAVLYGTNSWDMPPALILAVAGILIATIGWSWRQRLEPLGVLAASAAVAVFPFWLHYVPAIGLQDQSVPESIRNAPILGKIVETIGVVTWPRSSTWEIFKVHGLFLAISALFLVSLALPIARQRQVKPLTVTAVAAGLFVTSVAIQFPGLFWFVGPAFIFCVLTMTIRAKAPSHYHVALFSLAFVLLSITELVFLEDAFGNRMNTVFKLYFQVWAIFAVAAAVALPVSLHWLRENAGTFAEWATAGILGCVLIGAMLYPPISAYHWTTGFDNNTGIDGLTYLQHYAPDEMAAVNWLNTHADSTDHILEAPGCSYGEDGPLPDNVFSMATGLATPLGWQFHEYQWRLGDSNISNEIDQRKTDVKTIYNSPTSPEAQALLKQYDIRYIIVGPIEQYGYGAQCDGGAPYSATGLAALDRTGWQLTFHNASVKIYQRP